MNNIVFITFYNDFSVGINILTSLLIEAGYKVSVIFFKLPIKQRIDWFADEATEFLEMIDCYGEILGGNAEVNPATEPEIELLEVLLEKLSPDVICFSSRTTDNSAAKQIIPKLREKSNAVFLAGGFGPSLNPEIYADLVDYVFIGEAENCIIDLMSAIKNNKSLKDFNNIAYKIGGNFKKNRLGNPDYLCFKKQIIPSETYFIENEKIYSFDNPGDVVKTHAYSTFYGRGCISKCSYCSTGNWRNLYANEGYDIRARRNRNVEDIIEELSELRKKGITFVHFRDEFMTDSYQNMKRFFELYEKQVNLPFWAYLVPQQMLAHPELVKKAVDAGWVVTEIGFQSGSDFINRTIFNRFIRHRDTLAYINLIQKYNILQQYDFIVFNPAEKQEHIEDTFKLLQTLPKKRAKLLLLRLHYFPNTPIHDILRNHYLDSHDFEYYYRIALLYLICFVVSKNEFNKILADRKLTSSSKSLKLFYRNYLDRHGIKFIDGTHAIPESITTHRYERIISKKNFDNIIVWKEDDYYNKMAKAFSQTNILYFIDESRNNSSHKNAMNPEILKSITYPYPLFICSPQKQEIKKKILSEYPKYPGQVYV